MRKSLRTPHDKKVSKSLILNQKCIQLKRQALLCGVKSEERGSLSVAGHPEFISDDNTNDFYKELSCMVMHTHQSRLMNTLTQVSKELAPNLFHLKKG